MKLLVWLYSRFSAAASYLQSPFLFVVRLYWGWQFAQTGWGKMHNIARITGFFASLNIPFPSVSAHLYLWIGVHWRHSIDPWTWIAVYQPAARIEHVCGLLDRRS